jgi:hypothetical protein
VGEKEKSAVSAQRGARKERASATVKDAPVRISRSNASITGAMTSHPGGGRFLRPHRRELIWMTRCALNLMMKTHFLFHYYFNSGVHSSAFL